MHIKNFEAVTKELQTHLVEYLEEKGIDTKSKFSCLDPKHDDSHPSCSVIPGGIRAYCHSQGHIFDIFDAVCILENKPRQGMGFVIDVIQYLAQKYNVQLELGELSEEKIQEIAIYRAYQAAANYIAAPRIPSIKVTKELTRRGWNKEVLTDTLTGYIDSFKNYRQHLLDNGYTEEFLFNCDLLRTDIFNENAIIFTTCDEHGRPVGFSARNLNYVKGKEDECGAKYINSSAKNPIFQKGKRLYGFNLAMKEDGPVYIFEGQGDVITALQAGIRNCCACGSTALTIDHVLLLKEYNKHNIILCLDADEAGQAKVEKLLDNRFAGHKDVIVSIVLIPDAMDPDDFIRAKGVDEFKQLAKWSAFEWRLDRFKSSNNSMDETDVAKAMIPFIVNEPSFLLQEKMCESLATATGFTIKALQSEVARLQNVQEEKKNSERLNIVERALKEAKDSPIDAEVILTDARNKLLEVSKRYDGDNMSEDACLKEIIQQRSYEETKSDKFSGFRCGSDLINFEEALCGEWDKDVLMIVGGKANVGKSAIMAKLAYSIASIEENDAMVIFLTIDDTASQFLPRLVSIAEGSKSMTLSQIKNPNYWAKQYPELMSKRKTGYDKVEHLVKQGRLIIKDQKHGCSLTYMETLIDYYTERFPGRRPIFFLDNFHLLSDFADQKDERVRFKRLSNSVKGLATRYHIPIMSTVEYTKIAPGIKPSNNNIAETVAMEYDSNLIVHMYNELHDLGPAANTYHLVKTLDGQIQRMPRIEMIFGKNKITSFKNSIYFDFFPSASDFRAVSEMEIAEQMQAQQEHQQKKGLVKGDNLFGK